MRKKASALFLSICMALGLSTTALAADMNLTINAPDELPEVGKTFTVTVDVSNNPGLAAVQFTLTYDEDLVKCTEAEAGEVLDGTLFGTNIDRKGEVIVGSASASDYTDNGELVELTFKVLDQGDLTFGLTDTLFGNVDRQHYTFSLSGGQVDGAEEPGKEPTKPEKEEVQKPEKEETKKPVKAEETKPSAEKEPVGFTDTAGHPSEAYIEEAVERGYFQGYADGSFKPNGSVTRGAFVTVLWRMAGRPEPTITAPFTDIGHVSAEFQKAITWAYEKGYISGRTATTFAPGDPMSRQATMKIIFFHAGGVSGAEQMFTSVYDQHYKDSASLPEWARAPMYWGIYHDLISGKTEDTLGAATNADRALLAEILVKYTDKFGA